MTVILAIDTATGPCSVAIWKDWHVTAYVENAKPIMQSASLVPMIEQALADSATVYADLTMIACTTGPGSFTGIRVGLATARGIALAANIPAVGFTTLEVLAQAASGASSILAILNAGKGECYYQGTKGIPMVGSIESAMNTVTTPALVVGNVTIEAEGFTKSPVTFPRADILAQLASLSCNGQGRPLQPFYIRDPDAKLPTKPY